MKKILFVIATLVALASCQKAELAEQNSVNTNDERVITAYFDNAGTKTALDGVTPKWASGDKIMLLDGSGKQEITLAAGDISSDGKSITITTTLSGTLYAVYPSTATDAEKIETENSVPVTLLAEQDGTFGSANICVAKEDDGRLAFKNVTSVLHLTQAAATTNVNEIILTTGSATTYIAGTGTVDISETTPALALSSDLSNKIKVKSANAESDYYIAVVPTTLPAGTAFGFATGSKLGGTNLSEAKTIAANTIYNIGSMDADAITPNTYHPYVEINGLKWATMNLGATSPKEFGNLYSWGNTTGKSGNSFSPGFTTDTYKNTEGYKINDSDYPWTMTKHDAANKAWGGTWRMPTGGNAGEFAKLYGDCINGQYDNSTKPTGASTSVGKGIYWCDSYDGVAGCLFCDGTNRLFFPAAGYSTNTSRSFDNYNGYWSSAWKSESAAYYLYFNSGIMGANGTATRFLGRSVRPVSD